MSKQPDRPQLGVKISSLNGEFGSTSVGGSWDFSAVPAGVVRRRLSEKPVIRGLGIPRSIHIIRLTASDEPVYRSDQAEAKNSMVKRVGDRLVSNM